MLTTAPTPYDMDSNAAMNMLNKYQGELYDVLKGYEGEYLKENVNSIVRDLQSFVDSIFVGGN
jgi:hypothetical protein